MFYKKLYDYMPQNKEDIQLWNYKSFVKNLY